VALSETIPNSIRLQLQVLIAVTCYSESQVPVICFRLAHPLKTGHVYMNLFTRNRPYDHLLKYLLFFLKHPVRVCIYRVTIKEIDTFNVLKRIINDLTKYLHGFVVHVFNFI
jgi:hypothetical protein